MTRPDTYIVDLEGNNHGRIRISVVRGGGTIVVTVRDGEDESTITFQQWQINLIKEQAQMLCDFAQPQVTGGVHMVSLGDVLREIAGEDDEDEPQCH